MVATPTVERRDVQILSDIRLMALALKKLSDRQPAKIPICAACDRVIAECERMIAVGPPEFRHVIEPSTSLEVIQNELKASHYSITRRTGS